MDEKEVSEMQEEMMTVLVVEPMKAPYVKSIPNELENLQQAGVRTVGGDILDVIRLKRKFLLLESYFLAEFEDEVTLK